MSQKEISAPTEIDDETISKIVPTLFTEMNDKFSKTRPPFYDSDKYQGSTSTTEHLKKDESTSIQALLRESEQLDAIIPVISSITTTMDKKISRYLLQAKQTCTSTITMLDTWNSIFSQAGYMKTLSDNANKNSCRSDTLSRESLHPDARPPKTNAELLRDKMSELETAKDRLREMQAAKAGPKARSTFNRRTATPGYAAATNASRGRIQKPAVPSAVGSRVRNPRTANGNAQNRPYVAQNKPRRSLFER